MYHVVICDDEKIILDDILHKVQEQFDKENILVEYELKCKGFIRCHKGYLVNSNYIVKIANGQLDVECNGYSNVIPVGRSYEKDVKRSILEMLRK